MKQILAGNLLQGEEDMLSKIKCSKVQEEEVGYEQSSF
jgi:hypothetical protein